MSDEQAAPETKGVTVKLLATVDLGPEIEGMAGRQLRMMFFTLKAVLNAVDCWLIDSLSVSFPQDSIFFHKANGIDRIISSSWLALATESSVSSITFRLGGFFMSIKSA